MPNLITVLHVQTDAQRRDLNDAVVAICSYEKEDGTVIDAVDISYMDEFPELQTVTVKAPMSSL